MRGRLAQRLVALALGAFAGCDAAPPAAEEAARYLDDPAFRRQALERALTNPDNSYSRQRLASYGVEGGWDALPEWIPRSRPLEAADAEAVRSGGLQALAARPAPSLLWDGARPEQPADWIELGRAVFFGYPLRAEPLLEHALADPTLAEQVGIERTAEGEHPGLRVIVDVDGKARVGMTCALCHTAVEDGALVVGRARRRFDYGRLRVDYHQKTGAPADPALLARMARWGPGRADVTEDDEDPVAIPDLWGLAAQSALNQAGTLRQREGSPVALAIRQETQLLHANRQRVRPPRVLALALAYFLRSLVPPERPRAPPDELATRGARLFSTHCRGCHANAAYGGAPVYAWQVGTDPALAEGQARGTGRYRPPALLDVVRAAPYLHHGAVPTLTDLLSPARLRDDYAGSPLGPGPVPGHGYGTDLDEDERGALVAFLERL